MIKGKDKHVARSLFRGPLLLMRPLSPIAPSTNRGIARYGRLHGNRLGSISPFRNRVMADALITDQEIAILCDVLEGSGANLNADKRKVLDQLIAKGFVVVADQESPAKYKLTGKAQHLLAERGVGLSGG
jgi:predicted transcriptional regulator